MEVDGDVRNEYEDTKLYHSLILLTMQTKCQQSTQTRRTSSKSAAASPCPYEPAAAPTDLGRIRPPLNQPLLPSGLLGDGGVLVEVDGIDQN